LCDIPNVILTIVTISTRDVFNILDHFLLSGSLFNHCVVEAFVLNNVDNTSDHDLIIVSLDLDVNFVGLSQRNITPRVSWSRAASSEISCLGCLGLGRLAVKYHASGVLG